MNITINNKRISGSLRAVEYAPLVHRYLIGHVLTEGHEPPELYNYSDRIVTTMECLNTLRSVQKTYHLDCRDSMLTCELVLPIAAVMGYNCEFHFQGYYPEIPVTEFFKALKVHGIRHEFFSGSRMRMWGKLTAGTFIIPAEAGTGFLSGLLMALPLLKENSVVMVSGIPESLEDIAITLQVLRDCNIRIEVQIPKEIMNAGQTYAPRKQGIFIGATFKITGNQSYDLRVLPDIEGDWTLASYFLTAGAVCGGPVTMSGLRVDTFQRSKQILDILRAAGALVEYGIPVMEEAKRGRFRSHRFRTAGGIAFLEEEQDADYIRVTGCGSDVTDIGQFFQREHLHAFDVDLSDVPELLPATALLATVADGISCIRGIDRSSAYVSFRINQMIDKLERQGIMIWEAEGNLYIEGYAGSEPLAGGLTACGNDDRIAMMAGIGSCISSAPVVIEDAEAIEKSYPDFFEDLMRLQVV